MGFNCGIVGLPNVGKSTLFNALTSSKNAQSANYPFCTIEPNVGVVTVPDERLKIIDSITKKEVDEMAIQVFDYDCLVTSLVSKDTKPDILKLFKK